MTKPILIADSGGTKTDWCYVDELGERTYFRTKSYHPSQWDQQFFDESERFWNQKEELKKASLFFYGAGCLNKMNNTKMFHLFKEWGFNDVHVYSDIEGAYRSLFGKNKGQGAILGTGSVFFFSNNGEELNLKGGQGYLIGDEGSGYYFGKMIISALLNDEFSDETSTLLFNLLGEKSEILKLTYGDDGKSYVSSISKIVQHIAFLNSEIRTIHEANLQLFIDKYIKNKNDFFEIAIVGSYGYANQSIFEKVFQKNGIKLIKCIQYPINSLADFICKL